MTAPDHHIHTPDGSCCAPKKFAHLHQHTQYSLLDGAAKLKDLLKWVKEVTPSDPACAITDHGNMHGAVHFYNYATGMGVKPILGYEAYIVPGFGTRRDKKPGQSGEKGIFHLTLLARDFQGYQNLCRLSSRGYTEGYYYKPRIDHELLQEHHQGVIAFSGCLGSEVQQLLMQGREDDAKKRLLWYRDLFGENYYIEIQDHGLPEQRRNNPILKAWAQELGIGMVATNDGHYVKKTDATAHETLLAIQTKGTMADENRFKFPCDEFYVKSLEEMHTALPTSEWGEEPFDNTARIAQMCNVELPVGKKRVYQMPALPIPEGRTMAEELRVQTYRGSVKRYAKHLTEAFLRRYAAKSWDKVQDADALRSYCDAIYTPKVDGEQYTPEQFAALDFTAHGAKLRARLPGFNPNTADMETLYTALAFIGSVWEELGKACGEKYTKYPALEELEAEEGFVLPDMDAATYGHALVLLRRAEYELSVINNMGFPDYFLIVADYINWAKDQGISVGPGRGSGAGSLVAYAIRITNLDPLEYELLFERFLNPDRISMPDFDIDFSDARREEVIQYVRRKYGDDKVAQIATFGTMASKACLKDVARVMSLPYGDVDKVSKLIPIKFGKSFSLEEARESVPDIQDMLKANKELEEAYNFAQKLEGLTRHASVHAAGVVIGKTELTDLVPLMRDTSGEGIVCQYDMKAVEDIGLIKMDFLGLRTLSFLEEAHRILKESKGLEVDFDAIPLNDEATFELLSRGDTKGVFQLEGAGIADASRRLKPRRLADIIALSALYRPGPMENIPTYVRRHHGVEEVDYVKDGFPHSEQWLTKILKETYGIPVYQEQIMQIASEVAGYSLGGADLLRRAMGKKDGEEMKRQRQLFIEGSKNNKIPADEANRLFDLLEAFANYGFNKCLTGNTVVYAAQGQPHTMRELFEGGRAGMELPSLDEGFTFARSRVLGVFQNGVKPTFRLTTSLGKTLDATGNHPLLTLRGWRNLEDLRPGDRVAAPARLPVEGTVSWPQHELVMLGWILSEGNTCHPCGAYVYTQNDTMLSDVCEAGRAFADTLPSVKRRPERQGVYDVYLGTGQRGKAGRSGVRRWLEGLGLAGQSATQKRLPTAAFELTNADLAVVLGRFWSGDGFVFGTGSNTTPYLATSSPELARQLQHLLLRLGVVTRLTEKRFAYKEGRTGYTLHVLGRRSLDAFVERVAPHIVGKDAQVAALRARLASTPAERETLDTLPPEIKAWVAAEKERSGLTWREVEQQSGVCTKELYGESRAHKKGFRRGTIAKLAEFFGSSHLEAACSPDLFWESVVSIEPLGEAMTYDLEVERTHNFVANDLIVHNSHSAAYGVITYQTAWLKANHPVEFMAALLTVERRDSDKVAEYASDARKMGVAVLPPDINRSGADFKVQGEEIYFGLYAIKGLGENAVQRILEERERGGKFKSLADFCGRVDSKTCNRKGLEALVKSGAFDGFGERGQLLACLDEAVGWAQGAAKVMNSGMDSLFGAQEVAPEPRLRSDVAPLSQLEKLSLEKEALGLYISGHPLEQHEGLREAATCRVADLETWFQAQGAKGRVKAVLAGMVESVVKKPTKSGGMMARFNLADESATIELVAFSRGYERMQEKLVNDTPALVIVEIESEDGGLRAIAEELVPVAQLEDVPKVMYVNIDLDAATEDDLADFQSHLDEHAGSLPTYFKFLSGDHFVVYQLDKGVGSPDAIRVVNQTFGWAQAYLAYDNATVLARFAPKPPAWQTRAGPRPAQA